MAEQKINFSIGSTFTGEGFQKAQAAVKQTNQHLNAAIGATNKITQAIGEMNGAAAKAANAVAGLTQAFAAGGAAGLAFQGAIVASNIVVDYFAQKASEAELRLQNMNAEIEATSKALFRAYSENTLSKVDSLVEKTKNITAELMKEAEAASEVGKAFREMQQSFNKVDAAGRMAEMNAELATAETEAQKAVIEAKYKLEQTIEDSKASFEKMNNNINDLASQISQYDWAMKNSRKLTEELMNEREKLEKDLHSKIADNAEKRAEINKRIDAIDAQLQKENKLQEEIQDKKTQAEYKLITAKNEAEAQQINQTEAEKQASQKLVEAIAAEEDARLKAAQKKAEMMEKEELARLQVELEEKNFAQWVKDQAKKIDRNIAEREKEWEEEFRRREEEEKKNSSTSNAWSNVDLAPVTERLDKMNKERLKSVQDIWADQRERNKQLAKIKADTWHYLRLAEKSEKHLSTVDKKFLETYKSEILPQLSLEEAKEIFKDIGNSNSMLSTKMKALVKSTDKIEGWLVHLGLK